jgi:hypothetical protein
MSFSNGQSISTDFSTAVYLVAQDVSNNSMWSIFKFSMEGTFIGISATLPVSGMNNLRMVYLPSNSTYYLIASNEKNLYSFNGTTLTLITTLTGANSLLQSITTDGTLLYIGYNGEGLVTIHNPANGNITGTITVTGSSSIRSLAIDTVNDILYTTDFQSNVYITFNARSTTAPINSVALQSISDVDYLYINSNNELFISNTTQFFSSGTLSSTPNGAQLIAGTNSSGFVDGTFNTVDCSFYGLNSFVFNSNSFYICDQANFAIRYVNRTNNTVSTFYQSSTFTPVVTTLTLTSSASSYSVGTNVILTAAVYNQNNNLLQGETISLVSNSATSTPNTSAVEMNAVGDGTYTYTVTNSTVGSVIYTAYHGTFGVGPDATRTISWTTAGGGGGGGGGGNPPCFLEGTKILCQKDYVDTYISVEKLVPGTLVKTYMNGYKKIVLIGTGLIENPDTNERVKQRLYKLSPSKYPELREDLFITGCHSRLVSELTDKEREETIKHVDRIFVTDTQYRLMACVDEKAEPWNSKGTYTIWHFALEHENVKMNHGVYANGLLVESCCIDTLKNKSNFTFLS